MGNSAKNKGVLEHGNVEGGKEGSSVGTWDGKQGGTWLYLQIQLHIVPRCHWQFGEGREDLPQKPKGDDTWGEGEAIRAGQSCLWVTEPTGALCPRRASGRGWESTVLPSKEEKLLVLPIDLKLPGVQRLP